MDLRNFSSFFQIGAAGSLPPLFFFLPPSAIERRAFKKKKSFLSFFRDAEGEAVSSFPLLLESAAPPFFFPPFIKAGRSHFLCPFLFSFHGISCAANAQVSFSFFSSVLACGCATSTPPLPEDSRPNYSFLFSFFGSQLHSPFSFSVRGTRNKGDRRLFMIN